MNQQFRTTPFAHQLETLEQHGESDALAVLWEQGTGKTKLTIDNFALLARAGRVNSMLVVAPPGVDRNWVHDELPKHLPEDLAHRLSAHVWQSPKASTKWHQAALKRLLHTDGLSVLCISYESFITQRAKAFVASFLRRRRVFYVLDESHSIKTPSAKRTISIIRSGRLAAFRRILSGTPMAVGPFDLYSQMRFLDEDFWKRHGLSTFTEFRQHFGIVKREKMWIRTKQGPKEQEIEQVHGYRNLDQLQELLAPVSTRVTKDQVLDLPPKLYSKRWLELTKEGRQVYEQLREELSLVLSDGSFMDASMAIVLLLRLQQVTCGYLPSGESGERLLIPGRNPRLDALEDLMSETSHKTIVWARFSHDIDLIMDRLDSMGRRPVRYDGRLTQDQCLASRRAFQDGDATDFVGNPAMGGTGITLTAAKTIVYYSNSFKLVERLQSEDRAHRIGQDNPVSIIDLMAYDTVDEQIVENLRAKRDIATQVIGDELKSWI